jgi:hypothetical protein
VVVSPDFEIVIPAAIVKTLTVQPGQQVQVFSHQGRLELVPLRPVQPARGALRGIDTGVDRPPAVDADQSPSVRVAYEKWNAVLERLDTLEAAMSALKAELAPERDEESLTDVDRGA